MYAACHRHFLRHPSSIYPARGCGGDVSDCLDAAAAMPESSWVAMDDEPKAELCSLQHLVSWELEIRATAHWRWLSTQSQFCWSRHPLIMQFAFLCKCYWARPRELFLKPTPNFDPRLLCQNAAEGFAYHLTFLDLRQLSGVSFWLLSYGCVAAYCLAAPDVIHYKPQNHWSWRSLFWIF